MLLENTPPPAGPRHDIFADLAPHNLASDLVAAGHPLKEVLGRHHQVSDKISLLVGTGVEDFDLHIRPDERNRAVILDEVSHVRPQAIYDNRVMSYGCLTTGQPRVFTGYARVFPSILIRSSCATTCRKAGTPADSRVLA
jgi:hypothetical protein